MKMRSVLVALSLSLAVVAPAVASVPAPAAMMVDANKILAEIDRRASVFEDQQYDATMKIYKAGELKKTLEFQMTMKGLDKQFLVFVAPGDVAGMKVLMQDAKTLYIYTPEFKKVRRVAAHMQNQGFMGSTFTYSDQTEVALAPYYDAKVEGKSGSETTLSLTPKEGVEKAYSRLEVVIDSKKGGVTKVRYYDGAGNHVRTQSRRAWTKINGELMPTEIEMEDHKAGDSTVINLSNVRVNQGVEDSLFSRRMLLRG